MPTYFSKYGTIDKIIYLGNKNQLKILSKGEIIFDAEATFRGMVVIDSNENYITNIHGITLYKNNLIKSMFIKCFLDFFVSKKIIDFVKVGGHGGSFAQTYWNIYLFQIFQLKNKKKSQSYIII